MYTRNMCTFGVHVKQKKDQLVDFQLICTGTLFFQDTQEPAPDILCLVSLKWCGAVRGFTLRGERIGKKYRQSVFRYASKEP